MTIDIIQLVHDRLILIDEHIKTLDEFTQRREIDRFEGAFNEAMNIRNLLYSEMSKAGLI